MLRLAEHWPIAHGHVELIEQSRDDKGFLTITLAYTYKVDGERYVGRDSFKFLRDQKAASFEDDYRGKEVLIHYKPGRPQTSLLARPRLG